MNTLKSKGLDLKGIAWFLAIAYGLAWLLYLPMYLDGKGQGSPWSALILLQNFTPAVATLIVAHWISPLPYIRAATGLRPGVKGTRWGWYYLFGLFGIIGFALAAPFLAALLGLYPLDLTNFSGYRASVASLPGGDQLLALGSIQMLVLIGHAAVDASAGAVFVFNQAGSPIGTAVVGRAGLGGLIMPVASKKNHSRRILCKDPQGARKRFRCICSHPRSLMKSASKAASTSGG